jgi:hypothetical protein
MSFVNLFRELNVYEKNLTYNNPIDSDLLF